ncbi:MAG: MogA/MoaB family molybdenum cofactor biosynthesis protein [Oscillospiraceae bacterium]|jgi:molybdenum cofactor synthesis domain-containing protein|nr:MogA/MoaB family molybdenum cofactor biosynthesis protein [Oscillospiraceae bacterium]
MSYTAAVITVSDKGYRGERVDEAGPEAARLLTQAGFCVTYRGLVPDEAGLISAELIKCADEMDVALIITTGGTGFSPRDITPEATLAVVERRTPGIPEAMRFESARVTNRAMLSRMEAGIRSRSLIVNLPGSTKAARENLTAALSSLEHGLEMLRGAQRDHE